MSDTLPIQIRSKDSLLKTLNEYQKLQNQFPDNIDYRFWCFELNRSLDSNLTNIEKDQKLELSYLLSLKLENLTHSQKAHLNVLKYIFNLTEEKPSNPELKACSLCDTKIFSYHLFKNKEKILRLCNECYSTKEYHK